MKNLVERFNSIQSLKTNLEKEIEDAEFSIQEYSGLVGEKIRVNEELSADDPDFLALKAKFDNPTNDKKSKNPKENANVAQESDEKESDEKESDEKESDEKESDEKESDEKKTKDKSKNAKKKPDKKKKSKKGKLSDKWYDLNEIHIYNGMGIKGELELYFKAIDELKTKRENLQRTLATLNNVLEKGLKEDMGCIAFRGGEGIVEIAFLKSSGIRPNFSLKSIYSGPAVSVENIVKIGV